MKKIISFVLIMILSTLGSVTFASASVISTKPVFTEEKGIVMTKSYFNDRYGKPGSKEIIELNERVSKATFQFESIKLDGDNLSFSANVNYNHNLTNMNVSGTLSYGYKHEKGINSIVGNLRDEKNAFNIVLFEIYNDQINDRVITNVEKKNSPHVKIYFTDNQENLFLFETTIPEELKSITLKNEVTSDSSHDAFWFLSVIRPYEQREIPVEDKILSMMGVNKNSKLMSSSQINDKLSGISLMGVGNYSEWAYYTTYYASFYVGPDYYQCWSLPYGSWKASDVHASDTTWISSFKIAEHVNLNGVTNRSINNPFQYRNVTLSTGVGAKTTIIRTYLDGSMIDLNTFFNKYTGVNVDTFVAEKLWSTIIPVAPSIGDISDWLTTIAGIGTPETVTLGSSNIKLNNNLAVAEKVSMQSNYSLYKYTDVNGANTGHYITFQTVSQFNSNSLSSSSTYGVMRAAWDVYYNGSKYSSGSYDNNFSYTAFPN